MQQHLAGHLEMIALLSLPNLDGIDNNPEAEKVESNEANRNYAESKAGDFDYTEFLVFRDNDRFESAPLATKKQRKRFNHRLNTESITYESRYKATTEAREDYSGEIVGEWLSEISHQNGGLAGHWQLAPVHNHEAFDESAGVLEAHPTLHGSGQLTNRAPVLPSPPGQGKKRRRRKRKPKNGHGGDNSPKRKKTLIGLAETAQDIAAALGKFQEPIDDQLDEITARATECHSTSSTLRELSQRIQKYGSPTILSDLETVRKSLDITFSDVQGLLQSLDRVSAVPSAEYVFVWRDLCTHFRTESGNSLQRRLEIYGIVLQQLSNRLPEGCGF